MTLTEAQAILTALKTAYTAVISGSEYTITVGGSSRHYKRNDIEVLRKEIEHWELVIAKIGKDRKGIPVKYGTSYR